MVSTTKGVAPWSQIWTVKRKKPFLGVAALSISFQYLLPEPEEVQFNFLRFCNKNTHRSRVLMISTPEKNLKLSDRKQMKATSNALMNIFIFNVRINEKSTFYVTFIRSFFWIICHKVNDGRMYLGQKQTSLLLSGRCTNAAQDFKIFSF